MNRRSFLKSLFAASTVAAVKPTYFFAPTGGWATNGHVLNGTTGLWESKTPTEIMADINALLDATWKPVPDEIAFYGPSIFTLVGNHVALVDRVRDPHCYIFSPEGV